MYELFKITVTAFADRPWALIGIIGLVGFGYLASMLLKNTKVTEAIAGRISVDHSVALGEISKGVTGIAANQQLIKADIDTLKLDVEALKAKACTNSGCPNRKGLE